jgi:hypothetical protein
MLLEAQHRQTLITSRQYLQGCALQAQDPSSLFKCPGFLLDYIVVDSMHAGDLGCFQDALGSLFWCEITCRQWYRNQRTGLLSLNADLKRYYAANKHLGLSSAYPLAISQIKGKDDPYPSLKCKAAECRHLARFGLILANRHRSGNAQRPPYVFRGRMAGSEQEHLDNLVVMFEGMVRYHTACSATPFVAHECRAALYLFLQSLSVLYRLWRTDLPPDEHGSMPFNLRPKAHALQHLADDKIVIWGSPARFWCYRDEDFIGTVKTIAAKSSHPRTIEQRVLEKLLIVAGLEEAP